MSEVRSQTKQAIRHFSDLIVWQKAFALGLKVFAASRSWPKEEKYALIDQVRRSSRSVGANVAEAWGKRRYEAHFIANFPMLMPNCTKLSIGCDLPWPMAISRRPN
jgi:hypothetical protein